MLQSLFLFVRSSCEERVCCEPCDFIDGFWIQLFFFCLWYGKKSDRKKIKAKEILNFVEKEAWIYICYGHLVDLAEDNQKKVASKIYWTVAEFGKVAGNEFVGGGVLGKVGGFVGCVAGLVGGLVMPLIGKGPTVERLIETRHKVGRVFHNAASRYKIPENEKDFYKPISIMQNSKYQVLERQQFLMFNYHQVGIHI